MICGGRRRHQCFLVLLNRHNWRQLRRRRLDLRPSPSPSLLAGVAASPSSPSSPSFFAAVKRRSCSAAFSRWKSGAPSMQSMAVDHDRHHYYCHDYYHNFIITSNIITIIIIIIIDCASGAAPGSRARRQCSRSACSTRRFLWPPGHATCEATGAGARRTPAFLK